jgi:8-oxo-dGTP pyrophosphatase MutT (NUDIX family)
MSDQSSRQTRPPKPPPPPRPWKGKPVTQEDYVADDGSLKPLDASHFCAAGALLWHRNGGEPLGLLAVERREGRRGEMVERYNFVGGKRDTAEETPRCVAARECWEETGEQLSATARKSLAECAKPVVWHSRSKYALFVHEVGSEDKDLAERVAKIDGPPSPEHDANCALLCEDMHHPAHRELFPGYILVPALVHLPRDCVPYTVYAQ